MDDFDNKIIDSEIIDNKIIDSENITNNYYEKALEEVSVIVYDYFDHFNKEYIKILFGNIYYPLEIYFNEYINLVFLGNSITTDIINKIGNRLDRLNYLYKTIKSRIIYILENEYKYKFVKKYFYNKIIGYILKLSHTITSFDKINLMNHIDMFINNY